MSIADPRTDKEAAWREFDRIRTTRELSRDLRRDIFEETNWRCCYCGVHMDDRWRVQVNQLPLPILWRCATVEHILRKADGGTDERANLTAACWWCNNNRDDMDALIWFKQVQWLKKRGEHPHFPTEAKQGRQ